MIKKKYHLLFVFIWFLFLMSCEVKKTNTFPTTPTFFRTQQNTFAPTQTRQFEIQDFIGLIIPPYPDEINSGGGNILGLSDNQWGISHIKFNNIEYFAFEKLVSHDDKGTAFWMFMDFLRLPSLGDSEVFLTSGCMLNNIIDPEIIVIAQLDPKKTSSRFVENRYVIKAWRAEREIGKFIEIDTSNITCYAD